MGVMTLANWGTQKPESSQAQRRVNSLFVPKAEILPFRRSLKYTQAFKACQTHVSSDRPGLTLSQTLSRLGLAVFLRRKNLADALVNLHGGDIFSATLYSVFAELGGGSESRFTVESFAFPLRGRRPRRPRMRFQVIK